MVVICAGMFRSGSTWQYQVALELARRSHCDFHAHGLPKTGRDLTALVVRGVQEPVIHILKTHAPDHGIYDYLQHPEVKVLFSYRDLRDVVYSMAHKLRIDFDAVIHRWRIVENTRINETFWTRAMNLVEQRYVTWLTEPRPYVVRIAQLMNLSPSDQDVDEIVAMHSLENQKQETANIKRLYTEHGVDFRDTSNAIYFDPASLLHWNHIREGRDGHWRELASPEQKQVLLRLCGDWLIKRGYEPDDSWAVSAKASQIPRSNTP